jgi:hypothetical protein
MLPKTFAVRSPVKHATPLPVCSDRFATGNANRRLVSVAQRRARAADASRRDVRGEATATARDGVCGEKPWAARSWHTPYRRRWRLSNSQMSRFRGAHTIPRCR